MAKSVAPAPYRGSTRIECLEARIAPATFIVSSLADSGDATLRDAIEQANLAAGADLIEFAPGLDGRVKLKADLPAITDDLIISGPGAKLLALDGGRKSAIFSVTGSGADVAISGLKLINGAAESGAALFVDAAGASVSITDCVLQGNRALGNVGTGNAFGGAIAVIEGAVAIGDSTITKNIAQFPNDVSNVGGLAAGGAIYVGAEGTLSIDGSTLSANRALTAQAFAAGGAIYSAGSLTVIDSIVSKNVAAGATKAGGGGIASTGTAVITNSQIIENAAQGWAKIFGVDALGGGICNDGTLDIHTSTISGNLANASGGHDGSNGIKGRKGENGGSGEDGTDGRDGSFGGAGGDGGDALGGGIYNAGSLNLDLSTISANKLVAGSGGDGGNGGAGGRGGNAGNGGVPGSGGHGGIGGKGGNSGDALGGGVYNDGNATFTHTSTISANLIATGDAGKGGQGGKGGKGGAGAKDPVQDGADGTLGNAGGVEGEIFVAEASSNPTLGTVFSGLIKISTGTLTLVSPGIFGGAVTVNSGVTEPLVINDPLIFSGYTGPSLTGGTLTLGGTISVSGGTLNLSSGGTINTLSGALNLSPGLNLDLQQNTQVGFVTPTTFDFVQFQQPLGGDLTLGGGVINSGAITLNLGGNTLPNNFTTGGTLGSVVIMSASHANQVPATPEDISAFLAYLESSAGTNETAQFSYAAFLEWLASTKGA